MLHDPAQPVPLQPRPDGPTYFLRVPVVADRAGFRHALAAAGARYWGQLDLARAARAATERLLAGMDEQAEWLGRIDAYATGIEAAIEAGGSGPEADQALDEALAVPPELALIMDALAGLDPLLAARVADNAVFPERAGVIATRLFLTGWEGEGLPPLRRGFSGVAEESLALIPTRDMVAIGRRVGELLEPRPATLGNSASPSSGPLNQDGSTAGTATGPSAPSVATTASA